MNHLQYLLFFSNVDMIPAELYVLFCLKSHFGSTLSTSQSVKPKQTMSDRPSDNHNISIQRIEGFAIAMSIFYSIINVYILFEH